MQALILSFEKKFVRDRGEQVGKSQEISFQGEGIS